MAIKHWDHWVTVLTWLSTTEIIASPCLHGYQPLRSSRPLCLRHTWHDAGWHATVTTTALEPQNLFKNWPSALPIAIIIIIVVISLASAEVWRCFDYLISFGTVLCIVWSSSGIVGQFCTGLWYQQSTLSTLLFSYIIPKQFHLSTISCSTYMFEMLQKCLWSRLHFGCTFV